MFRFLFIHNSPFLKSAGFALLLWYLLIKTFAISTTLSKEGFILQHEEYNTIGSIEAQLRLGFKSDSSDNVDSI